jgi:hypothetical protein
MKFVILIGVLILAIGSMQIVRIAATPEGAKVLDRSGSDPTVAFDVETGSRCAAWIRPGKDDNEVVLALSDNGRDFSDPVVVSGGDTGIEAGTVNPAQVRAGTEGGVFVLYERRVPSDFLERGRGIPRLARSTDGGRTFANAVDVVSDEGIETSAQNADLAVTRDGTIVIAWLDYRNVVARAKLPEGQRPEDKYWLDSDDPSVQVRTARSTDGGQNFSPSLLMADGASERSRVALATSPDGTLYAAWRGKINQFKGSYDAVRDVLIASSKDGGLSWSSLVRVQDDRFKAGDCPEITLGMAANSKGRLHVAWYSGSGLGPGILLRGIRNQGRSFSEPRALLSDSWVPYADVKLAVDGGDQVWVALEDRRDEKNGRVTLFRIDPEGTLSNIGSWSGDAPDIAALRDSFAMLWHDEKGAIRALRALPN